MAYRYEATERFWASAAANLAAVVARVVFSGKRSELRQRYREGQEDQRGALGLPRRRPKNALRYGTRSIMVHLLLKPL